MLFLASPLVLTSLVLHICLWPVFPSSFVSCHILHMCIYLYVPKYVYQDQGVVDIGIQCLPKLPVLIQAMAGLLGGISTDPGSASRGQFG